MDYPLFLFIVLILLALQDVLEAQCGMVQHNENLLWNSFMMLFNSLNEQPRVGTGTCTKSWFSFQIPLLDLANLDSVKFQTPHYVELKTISLGFSLWSFTISYFKLLIIFVFSLRVQNSRVQM